MGFRFHKRIKIFPGVTLNLGKKSASISIGTRGAKFTIGPGRKHVTVGLPGTGLFYTEKLDKKKKSKSKQSLFSKKESQIFSSGPFSEKNNFFLKGINAYNKGNLNKALEYFNQDASIDAQFFMGLIYIRKNEIDKAIEIFEKVIRNKNKIGQTLQKMNLNPIIHFSITKEIIIQTTLSLITAYLILTELYQSKEDLQKAFHYLQKAYEIEPTNPFILLSFIELMYDYSLKYQKPELLRKIINLSENISPDNFIVAGILFYRALTLELLNRNQEALEILNTLLENKDIISKELIQAIKQEKNKILLQNNKISFKELF
ncbi:MAG: hypothetical protein KatS3mg129_2136 [Leptospiraceae bacterium]|nr:MAG: hypothetical protein KatS3mg129_2136 [Leptospiraceae bacterium]